MLAPTPLALLPDWLVAAAVWVLFLMITGFFVFLFVALWVREDAQRRGMSGAFWAIVLVAAGTVFVFIGGLVVLVVYFLVRIEHPGIAGIPGPAPPPPPPPPSSVPAAPPVASCKTCGAPLAARAAFCANCGAKV